MSQVWPPLVTGSRESQSPGPMLLPTSTSQLQFAWVMENVPFAYVTIGAHGALMQSAYLPVQMVAGPMVGGGSSWAKSAADRNVAAASTIARRYIVESP